MDATRTRSRAEAHGQQDRAAFHSGQRVPSRWNRDQVAGIALPGVVAGCEAYSAGQHLQRGPSPGLSCSASSRPAAKAITDAMVEHCSAPREGTTVVFLDVPRDSWARAGVVVADREAQARPAGS